MSDFRDFLKGVAGARPQAVQAGVSVVVRDLLQRLDFVKTIEELLECVVDESRRSGRHVL